MSIVTDEMVEAAVDAYVISNEWPSQLGIRSALEAAFSIRESQHEQQRNAIIEQCAKTGGDAFRKNRAAFPTQEASFGVKAHHIEDAIRALKLRK